MMNLVKLLISDIHAENPTPCGEWSFLEPHGFKEMKDRRAHDGRWYWSPKRGQSVCVSVHREQDGRNWIHLSIAHPEQDPTLQEMQAIKDAFVGPARKAIMVFPKRSEHVNLHPHCFHLFALVDQDKDLLPDFRRFNATANRMEI
jgi:hypothetical protein